MQYKSYEIFYNPFSKKYVIHGNNGALKKNNGNAYRFATEENAKIFIDKINKDFKKNYRKDKTASRLS